MATDLNSWEVVVVDDLDPGLLKLVSDFFNECFPGVFPGPCKPEIFEWKLGNSNPAGRGFLTVAMAQGRVIGTTSATVKKVKIDENIMTVLEIGDTFTHPEWRKKGNCNSSTEHLAYPDEYFSKSVFGRLVLETMYRAKQSGFTFIYGTPNGNSYPPYIKRLSFQELNQSTIVNQLTIGMNYAKKNVLIKSYGKMIHNFYELRNRIRIHPIKIVEFNPLLDNSPFDDKSGHTVTGLAIHSDLEWIKHRYLLHPSSTYRFFRILNGKDVKGVIVATTLMRPSGFRTLLISEYWSEQTSFSQKLKEISVLLQKNFSRVEVISFWRLSNQRRGPFSRRIRIIGKNLKTENGVTERNFENFHMGWSDNG
jgi:hypothetical protein